MRALSLLVTTLLVAAGCASTAPAAAGRGASPELSELFPLAVGNEWVWDDLSPQLPAGGRPSARTVRIVERTGDGYFRDNERTELRVDGECVRDRIRRLLCRPLAAGTGWKSVVSVSSTERYEIVGVNERVEVPAGRFDRCVRVRANNRAGPKSEQVMELTYAPGVGPVRLETWAIVDGAAVPQIKAVLRSFRTGAR